VKAEVSKPLSIDDRIANLGEFRELWVEFANFVTSVGQSGNITPSNEAAYQNYLARIAVMFPRVQTDVQKHGPTVIKAVAVGGGLYRNVPDYTPFLNISATAPGLSTIFRFGTGIGAREFFDDVSLGDRILLHSIGTLEFAKDLGGEGNLPVQEDSPAAFVEVLSAIRRALRPAFKKPPANEIEVQDQVEVILRAQGIDFEREPQIEHATKKVKPDFALPTLDTALEIKFCNSTRREKEIIEEIGADIVAYRTKYRAMLFVVYDVATISDKESFVKGFGGESGVLIEIIS
jgi:hypothetical protein